MQQENPREALQSKHWQQVFKIKFQKKKNSEDNHFLNVLTQEYKSCKDKQIAKQISTNAKLDRHV